MGGEPYFYFVPYQENIGAALQQLREREFQAGRYNPVMGFPCEQTAAPGAGHANIREARIAAAEDGTRSILDIDEVSEVRESCAAAPLEPQELQERYGTLQPTREMIEQDDGFLEDVDRGECVYIVFYHGSVPEGIYFGGYSFD